MSGWASSLLSASSLSARRSASSSSVPASRISASASSSSVPASGSSIPTSSSSVPASSRSASGSGRIVSGSILGVTAIVLLLLPLKVTLIGVPIIVVASAVSYMRKGTCASTPYQQSGQPFVEMMCNTEYRSRYLRFCFRKALDIPGQCHVYLMKRDGGTGLHWALLIKMNRSDIHLPYLSIEVTTDDSFNELIPTMRQFNEFPTSAISKGFVDISIKELCQMADTICYKMGNYQLTSHNCQTFCNELLEKMNLPQETTTFEELRNVANQCLELFRQ